MEANYIKTSAQNLLNLRVPGTMDYDDFIDYLEEKTRAAHTLDRALQIFTDTPLEVLFDIAEQIVE